MTGIIKRNVLPMLVICLGVIQLATACTQGGTLSGGDNMNISSGTTGAKQKEVDLQIIQIQLPENLSEERTGKITHIMLHFISNVTQNQQQPYIIDDIVQIFKSYEVSSHYLIGRDGQIYQLVSENKVAYHAGKGSLDDFPEYDNKLNGHSIGIEMMAIGTQKEMSDIITEQIYNQLPSESIGYTQAQYIALNALLESLTKRHPEIKNDRKHIIGHDEYATGRKTDPGSLFEWSKIGL